MDKQIEKNINEVLELHSEYKNVFKNEIENLNKMAEEPGIDSETYECIKYVKNAVVKKLAEIEEDEELNGLIQRLMEYHKNKE